jgi:hypothetical protein
MDLKICRGYAMWTPRQKNGAKPCRGIEEVTERAQRKTLSRQRICRKVCRGRTDVAESLPLLSIIGAACTAQNSAVHIPFFYFGSFFYIIWPLACWASLLAWGQTASALLRERAIEARQARPGTRINL